jgi:hypothetical protein
MSTEPLIEPEREELERLRRRVAELEDELFLQAERINRIVGNAQAKTYWLDRWHVDLNTLMTSRQGTRVRALARAVRGPVRLLRRLRRTLLG